jgi:rod shape determining protein RodA
MNYRKNKFLKESFLNLFLSKLFRLNWVIVFCVFLLCLIGVAFLYSAAGGQWNPWAKSHLYRSIIGIGLMLLIALLPPKFYNNLSISCFILGLLSLLFVKFFGQGSVQRWISIGGFNFQPSEPIKLALILVLAKYFDNISKIDLQKVSTFLLPIIFILLPGIFVVTQPDLGTGLAIILLGIAILFYIGIPLKIVFLSFIVVISCVPIIWNQLYEYQKNRILVFLNPQSDSLGSGYQIIQSKIAIGSGGLFGKGYLLGSQSRLNYLPEKHTDFVFTLISEEMGFLGSLILIFLFCFLIALIMRISFIVDTVFAKIVVFGVGFLIFLYVALNIGMVCGLLPVVGAPLPLISHGGTSLITILIGIGLVLSMSVHNKRI